MILLLPARRSQRPARASPAASRLQHIGAINAHSASVTSLGYEGRVNRLHDGGVPLFTSGAVC